MIVPPSASGCDRLRPVATLSVRDSGGWPEGWDALIGRNDLGG